MLQVFDGVAINMKKGGIHYSATHTHTHTHTHRDFEQIYNKCTLVVTH